MLAQVLRLPDLESGVVHLRDQVPRAFELPVREHVAVDEPVGDPGRGTVVRPGDAVVQQPAARVELAVQEAEVAGKLGLADVLGEPDRADRVEPGLADLAVVQVPDLGEVVKARLLDGPLRPHGLLLGQGDAERADAVLARRVQHHAAPAATHVEQPHARLQPDLPGHQVELVLLRLLQGGIGARVARAGVGHRRPEHPLVERVGDVVVVRDRAGVAGPGVPAPGQPAAVDPDLLRRRRDPADQQLRAAELGQHGQPLGRGQADPLRACQPGQRHVHVAVDVEMPGDEGPGQAERAGRLRQVRHGDRAADTDRYAGRTGAAGAAAVVGHELHVGIAPGDPLEYLS